MADGEDDGAAPGGDNKRQAGAIARGLRGRPRHYGCDKSAGTRAVRRRVELPTVAIRRARISAKAIRQRLRSAVSVELSASSSIRCTLLLKGTVAIPARDCG